jgi:hypothetical protein
MKIILTTLALFFMIAASSCGGDGNGNGSANPTSGTWYFTPGAVSSDTCNYSDTPVDPSGNFQLQNNGDGTLLLTPSDGTPAFTCSLSGSSLSCPDRAVEDIDATPLAAVFHIHATAQATFSSDTAMSGSQTANVTCDGAQCAMAATAVGITLPCSYTQSFTASLVP